MSLTTQLAKHFREVYFGGNWTTVNMKDTLAGVSWQQATARVHSLNTIATLVYHTGYYVQALLQVLQGGPLDAHDSRSFTHPPITAQQDWEALQATVCAAAEQAAPLLEQLPESRLWEPFTNEKYGSYYRNIAGITEHTHYHLGQIVLIKKLLAEQQS